MYVPQKPVQPFWKLFTNLVSLLVLAVRGQEKCKFLVDGLKGMELITGFPRISKNHLPYFVNTFLILNLRSSMPLLLFIF